MRPQARREPIIRLILRGAIVERRLSDPALTTFTPATLRPAEPLETKFGPERVISSDPNFQRVNAVAFLPKAFGRGPL